MDRSKVTVEALGVAGVAMTNVRSVATSASWKMKFTLVLASRNPAMLQGPHRVPGDGVYTLLYL